jgi:hypothetical protein
MEQNVKNSIESLKELIHIASLSGQEENASAPCPYHAIHGFITINK